jgi:hypothetical protein
VAKRDARKALLVRAKAAGPSPHGVLAASGYGLPKGKSFRTPILGDHALDATDNFDLHLFLKRDGTGWAVRADFTEWTKGAFGAYRRDHRRERRVYFDANDIHAFIAARILRVARAPEKGKSK